MNEYEYYPTQIPHAMLWKRTRAPTECSRRLTAWAV